MKLSHPELQSRLAAEYVLGTMRPRVRRRFAEYVRRDATLAAVVRQWEERLTPLARHVPDVSPPERLWRRIETRLWGHSASGHAVKHGSGRGLWHSLPFWRNLGLAASAFAAVLTVAVLASGAFTSGGGTALVAVLETDGVARMLVEQPKPGMLTVTMIKPWKHFPEHSLELWVLPKDGAPPRSLGVIAETGDTRLSAPGIDAKLADGLGLAMSKEPHGGSPTGLPTGPILCKGSLAKRPPAAKPRPQI